MQAFAVPTAFDRDDLVARLERTRFPVPTPGEDWSRGTPPAFLRRLVDRWLHGYDWSVAAAAMNRHPHALAETSLGRLHLVHRPNPGRPAVVLLHGWPSTFLQLLPLVDLLADDFEVVVPSLPGFAYSPPLAVPFGEEVLTRMVHELMTEVLGHRRYLTYGEDVGTWVSDRLAGTHPEHVAGIAVTHPAYPPADVRASLGPETVAFFAEHDRRWEGERAYAEIQATKPDTLAAALGDSPAGLASWIVEKFRGWSDCDGDVESVFPLDELITTAMLFWTTDSIGTSLRPYAEDAPAPPQPPVLVPATIGIPVGDRGYPRSLAEHTYRDIRVFRPLERGAHFTAREVPQEVARLIREVAAAS